MNQGNSRHSATTILVALVLTVFAIVCAPVLVYAMLASLFKVFPDPPLGVGWTITIYMLVAAVAAALCGRFGDLIGCRRMLIIVLAMSAVGAMLSAATDSMWLIVAGCALQGVTGAALPLCIGVARESLPPDRIAPGVGIITAAASVGSGLFFFAGGAVVDSFTWRGGFVMTLAFNLLGIVVLRLAIPPSPTQAFDLKGIKLAGGLLFVPALLGILFVVERAAVWGWSSPRVSGTIVACLLLLAFWARHQARQQTPLINVRLFASRQFLLANICMIFTALGCMSFGQIGSLLFQQPSWTQIGFGLSAMAAGALLLPINATAIIAGPWSGRIAARAGARRAALQGGVLVTLAWLALVFFHGSMWIVFAALFVAMFGFAVIYPAIFNLIVEATPPECTGEATGMAAVFSSAFMAVGAQLVFACLATSSVSDPVNAAITFPSESAYTLTFGYVAAMSALALITAWLLPRRNAPMPALAATAQAAVPAAVPVKTATT